jgi:hypothetical protein
LNSDRTNVPISTIEILRLAEGECDEKRLGIILADTVGGIESRYDLDEMQAIKKMKAID